MYRVGFGDCFLVSFGRRQGRRHVLIDCGVHPGGNIKTLDEVLANIKVETGGSLALVIASHMHEDHISAFGSRADRFCGRSRDFTVGQVWLPWTEDPDDAQANRLKSSREGLVRHLELHLAALEARGDAQDYRSVKDLVLAARRNEQAVQTLRDMTGKPPVYFAKGVEVKDAGGIPGLRARLLGPPRDELLLGKKAPPTFEHYLDEQAGADTCRKPPERRPLFPQRWVEASPEPLQTVLDRDTLEKLHLECERSTADLAYGLDDMLNNTSLVILFEYEGKKLLFPGDAQWGGWKSWLDQGTDVLRDLDFYKVSHHGSVNATPRTALEAMPGSRFAAMVSTQGRPWPSIPQPQLMAQLDERTGGRFVRSDSLAVGGAPGGPRLKSVPEGFSSGPLWFDWIA